MDCACGPSKGHMDDMKKLFNSSKSLEEFSKSINEVNIGASSWCEGQELFFSYPTCYCSCVKKINKPLSKTWCFCTLGYTKVGNAHNPVSRTYCYKKDLNSCFFICVLQ